MSSDYSFDQIGQLVTSLRRNGWTKDDVTKLGQCGEQRSANIRLFLDGRAEIVFKPESKPKPETVIISVVHVDRSVRPSYPDWTKEALHPELENSGLAEYDLGKLEQWLHDGQKNGGWVKGQKIYEHLKDNKMLESCLSLRDLEEIQKLGIETFRKHFRGKAVFAWKSVVRHRDGYLNAPYLDENGGKVILYWYWLEDGWYGTSPALRLAS